MGYLKIPNLYQNTDILLFKECFALEKIHGTSASISWKDSQLSFFSGGEKHEKFVALFNHPELCSLFTEHFGPIDVKIYGEAYGGILQGMSATYGPDLKFVVFDVSVNSMWLSVDKAHNVANKLKLEFVDYVKIPTDLSLIDEQRDRESVQAIRNGVGPGKPREGIVLRPPIEATKNNGSRFISKHKSKAFSELSKPRKVLDELKMCSDAENVAEDWVTPMRLNHVIDRLITAGKEVTNMSHTSVIIKTMIEDVRSESTGEIDWGKPVEKAIAARTAKLWKNQLKKQTGIT